MFSANNLVQSQVIIRFLVLFFKQTLFYPCFYNLYLFLFFDPCRHYLIALFFTSTQ
jgi:hypothetical protein